jgi:hypothetical protein
MTAKTNKRKQRSARHLAAYRRGIVLGPLRSAFEAMLAPRINAAWRRETPSIAETYKRLGNGRATQSLIRHWCNGTRRAPAWFVEVLRSELLQRRAKLDAVLADLDGYKPLDRAERSRKLAAKARAEMAAGKGAIGQQLARKRQEALEREQRLRAIYPPPGENNAPAGVGVANAAEKSTQ